MSEFKILEVATTLCIVFRERALRKIIDSLLITLCKEERKSTGSDDINHVSEQFNPHYSENVGLQCHYQGQN